MSVWPRTAVAAERWWQNLVLTARFVVTAAAAAAAIVGALINSELVEWSYWWVLAPAVIAAVGVSVDTLTAAVRKRRAPRKQETLDAIRQASASAIKEIRDHTSLPLEAVGACVWEVRSYRPLLWRPRLRRVIRFRIDTYPSPSPVDWIEGKGTIGECWLSKAPKHRHVKPIADRWCIDGAISDRDWARIPSKTKAGMSRQDFQELVGKYAEVLATPIKDQRSGALLGVLSIDLPYDAAPEDGHPRLNSKVVKAKAGASASVVSHLLKQA
ncbi:hypothetical protein PU560_09635 [Georgenia sp. 10Sc9-8]|uniref:GAF domain-containing protein n=1 Tax=Georgenia halotolerans TaxID=3028317 RepID=A0ABT5U017_9MICO|nr:hypothetical protein [Georgenia halotolerans]